MEIKEKEFYNQFGRITHCIDDVCPDCHAGKEHCEVVHDLWGWIQENFVPREEGEQALENIEK